MPGASPTRVMRVSLMGSELMGSELGWEESPLRALFAGSCRLQGDGGDCRRGRAAGECPPFTLGSGGWVALLFPAQTFLSPLQGREGPRGPPGEPGEKGELVGNPRCQGNASSPFSPAWHRSLVWRGALWAPPPSPCPSAPSPALRALQKSPLLSPTAGWPWHQGPPRRHRPQGGECEYVWQCPEPCARSSPSVSPLSPRGHLVSSHPGSEQGCEPAEATGCSGGTWGCWAPSPSPPFPAPWRCQTEPPIPFSQGLPGIDGKDGTPGIPGVKVRGCGGLLGTGEPAPAAPHPSI